MTRDPDSTDRLFAPDVLHPDLIEAARKVRADLAVDAGIAVRDGARWAATVDFREMYATIDAVRATELDGVALDLDATLRAQVVPAPYPTYGPRFDDEIRSFADVYAGRIQRPSLDRILSVHLNRPMEPIDRWSPPELGRDLDPERFEPYVRVACGPATRLRLPNTRLGRRQPPLGDRNRRLTEDPDVVRARLRELAAWAADDDLPPGIVAAVVFGRLLLLHPFRKANVRCALLATDLCLRRYVGGAAGWIGLAAELGGRSDEWTQDLNRLAHGTAPGASDPDAAWRRWTARFLELAFDAVQTGRARHRAWTAAVRAFSERLDAPDARSALARRRHGRVSLVRALRGRPYVTRAHLDARGLARPATAGKLLRTLARLGETRPHRSGTYRVHRVERVAEAFGVPRPPDPPPVPIARLTRAAAELPPLDPHDA